jgi:hypothetical protein
MAGWQLCSSHSVKLINLHSAEAWEVNFPMGQTDCFPHQLFHCNVLLLLVCICCCSFCQRFCKNCPHWLDSQWKAFISSLLSLWGRMHNYSLLLLIWSSFEVLEPSSCDLCMHTTGARRVVTRTLLFHTYYFHSYYSCAGSVIRSCTHNHTTYLVCSHGNQHICFNPTYHPQEQCLEIQGIWNPGNLVS